MMQRISGGRLLENVARAVERVSAQVVATGEKGRVTITLVIARPSSDDAMVTIQERIGETLPSRKGEGAFFFSHEGALHTKDPRQTELDLVVVEGGKAQIREPVAKDEQAELRGAN